jgi:CRISPR-associated protein Cst1
VKNIFTYTGNPFVDAGITAMLVWLGKEKPEEIEKEDVKKLIEDIKDLYTKENWNKIMYSIFPNSKLTNPSVKDKKGEYGRFLNELLSEITLLSTEGNCIACGRCICQVKNTPNFNRIFLQLVYKKSSNILTLYPFLCFFKSI